ncbi:tyrosine-type recombinase/integrase [Agrobacterium rhizogenes]|nr:tyrosine-type recombinase/integrase [Rhizobium rhizogenes]NTH70502.1 tyrosine-type recombinase/integrase [Rhizobium rhizogenes]
MKSEDVSKYVIKHPVSGIYRYYRRVPTEVAHLDARTHVKQSLKTKHHKEALERAESIHKAADTLWRSMLAGNDNVSALAQYEAAVKAAQSLGFVYRSAAEASEGDLLEINERYKIAEANYRISPVVVNAVMGTAAPPSPKLSNIWELYEEHNASGLKGMSPDQLRKHKVSRLRAIEYAKEALGGDLQLSEIKRADVLKFRGWWLEKIEKEKLKAYSANRCFSDIKGMLTVIDDALQTESREPWDKIRLKATNSTKLGTRPPFPVQWVQEKILAPGALDNLNEDARLIVYVMAETGMRLGEVCNLRPQDIRLDDEIPHVEVADREDRRQKTDYSIRRIPLVGVALWAIKQRPNGFPRYADNADSASAIINKIMSKNGLRPTPKHSVYSLRHTFQDRIENAEASDRMQADLMGHEFGRPAYGDGAEMKRRQVFLDRIKLKWTVDPQ